MAKLTPNQVLSMIESDGDWATSDEGELSDDEDFSNTLANSLDRAQASSNTISTLPFESETVSDDDSPPNLPSSLNSPCMSVSPTGSPSRTTSAVPTDVLQSTPVTSSSSSMSVGPRTISTVPTAVAFQPPPFTSKTGPSSNLDSHATPLDFFQLIFDDQVFQLIVEQTNLYAAQNPPSARYPWVDTNKSEMKSFLGIIIAMGFHSLPQTEDYWSSDPLLKVPGIVDGMPINRFKLLLRCLHLNDNTTMKPRGDPGHDKLHKIRPLLTMARENFMREYHPSRQLSVDEAMVGYKGRSSLKQYVPMKPTKRGYKVWCLCDATNGYMCNFEVYTGAGSVDTRSHGGLGPFVVLNLVEPYKNLVHFVYFDNYFSTVDLASRLLECNTYSCGTARSNRKKFPNTLKNLKLDRGASKSELVENDTVNCISWQDKKLVHFIDTISDPNEVTQVSRKNKDGTRVLVDCPQAVKRYNIGMGGVDLSDAKRKVYSCSRKAKKWWHRLFYFILDVCIVNTHIIQSETPHQPKLKQKQFRLELVRELLSSYNSRKHHKRGRSSSEPSPSLLLSENHYPDKLSKPLQCRYCALTKERRRTSFCCKTCNSSDPVPLCVVPCFQLHHTKGTNE